MVRFYDKKIKLIKPPFLYFFMYIWWFATFVLLFFLESDPTQVLSTARSIPPPSWGSPPRDQYHHLPGASPPPRDQYHHLPGLSSLGNYSVSSLQLQYNGVWRSLHPSKIDQMRLTKYVAVGKS